MCGIGGIMMYGKNRTKEELAFIKELATNIAVENMARGSHATGIAVLGQNNYDVLKHNVGADEFTTYDTYYDFIDKNINNNTYNILIHTRHATKGSPNLNDNNHPIVTATSIGIHNGWVNNDDELFDKEGLYRLAQVDSEVIFRLADKELANEMNNTKNVAEKLSGVYAVAFVKKDEPHKLNYFKSSNPTTFAYIPELNIIVFASQEKYIKDSISNANTTLYYETGFSISELSVKYYIPNRDTVYQFDVTENTPIQQLEQTPLSFQDSDDWYYDYGYGNNYYSNDWYYDRYSDRKNELEEEKKITNIYEFIEEKGLEHLMSDDDYAEMIELLDQAEKNEWSKGYSLGRQSTDNDIKILKEQIKTQTKLAN